jgi:undecaprenyl-diphosphatase
MFEAVVLGIVQGIAEWLPVSSEGLLVFIQFKFFGVPNLLESIRLSLFLHLGTFLAALIYFRDDILRLFKGLIRYRSADKAAKSLLKFYAIATLVSGALAFLILRSIENLEEAFSITGKAVLIGLGLLLLITGILQILQKREGKRGEGDVKNLDSILLGFAQGFAALPGLSRSGLTVSTLLLRKFKDTSALKLSFILSLPIVLGGNILLNLRDFTLNANAVVGLIMSFLFGLLTIHLLINLARRMNFGWFVFIFGILVIGSAFI